MRISTLRVLGPAQALEFALLQNAQQLYLNGCRHVADLVEEKRAFIGQFKLAWLAGQRPSKGSALKTEEFALEERVWNGGAVDFDERSGGPPRILVNRPCDQVFANATLAANEHRRIRGRHALHQ